MKKQNKSPFQAAEIEIVSVIDDVITISRNPFEGEEDDLSFHVSWRDYNGE